eukprot:COSAG02_NODE_269_length_26468_cov_4.489021_9_plen_75_part_00
MIDSDARDVTAEWEMRYYSMFMHAYELRSDLSRPPRGDSPTHRTFLNQKLVFISLNLLYDYYGFSLSVEWSTGR